jgi:hypothetical protein
MRDKNRSKGLVCASAMLTVILVLSAFTIGIVPVSAVSVTRDLPDCVATNEEFTVTLTQTGFDYGAGIVVETLPEGFEYVGGSYTGGGPDDENVTYDSATRKLRAEYAFVDDAWGELTSVTYRVRASSYGQKAVFTGKFSTVDDPSAVDTGGNTVVCVDEASPHTTDHDPAKSATGVPVDTNIVVHVRDDCYVDINSIVMTLDSEDVTSDLSIVPVGLVVNHFVVTYDPPANFSKDHTVVVTVDAKDGLGNVMTQDVYSFTTETEGGAYPNWDINEDGKTDYLDAAFIGIHYGETTSEPYPRYDINKDGKVDYLDAAFIGIHYGEVSP